MNINASQLESTASTTSADPFLDSLPETSASSQEPPSVHERHSGAEHAKQVANIIGGYEPAAGSHTERTGSGAPNRPSYVQLGQPSHPGKPPFKQSNIKHPVRPSIEAEEPQAFNGPPAEELTKLIDKAHPYAGELPSVEQHDIAGSGLKKYEQESEEGQAPENAEQKPGMPGYVPKDPNRITSHPKYADYKQRRPEQLLSHFSSIMLYHAKQDKTNPVEVQFGYLQDGDKLKLYSSANSYKGQQWLKNNSSGDGLLNRVKDAARQDEFPDVKRHALKLLYFEENQKARRDDIEKDPTLSNADKKRLRNDLDLTNKLHKEFFTGTHHVVTNSNTPAAQPQASKKKAKEAEKLDKGKQRHAEQNISEQMHADMDGRKAIAEIAGTKIRCGSCNSTIGPSIKDSEEGYYIAGQYYPGQASKSEMTETIDKDTNTINDDEYPARRPGFVSSVEFGHRSNSTSPFRPPKSNGEQQ